MIDIGQDRHAPAQQGSLAVLAADGVQGQRPIRIVILVHRNADLLQVVLADPACGGLAHLIDPARELGDLLGRRFFLARFGAGQSEQDLTGVLIAGELGGTLLGVAFPGRTDHEAIVAVEFVDPGADLIARVERDVNLACPEQLVAPLRSVVDHR